MQGIRFGKSKKYVELLCAEFNDHCITSKLVISRLR